MNLSICMIVKNEAALLPDSLQAARRFVDDIVVVDTGSTDNTREIACSFMAQVYDFTWCDDFAAARNFSLAQAAHDWVLVLDADEIITAFLCEQVQGVMTAAQPAVGRIRLINVRTKAEQRTTERISRLFDRRVFRYEGSIHEQVVRIDGAPYPTVPVEITVEHLGYSAEVIERTAKIARNMALLQQALRSSPEDAYLLYQLGKTHYLAQNYAAAADCFARALELPLNFALEYMADLVQAYGYALINSGRYQAALCLTSYERYYAASPDYLFLLGLVYMNNAMFPQAIAAFLQCRAAKPGKTEGVNSWRPAHNIAVIYDCLGHPETAAFYYQLAKHER